MKLRVPVLIALIIAGLTASACAKRQSGPQADAAHSSDHQQAATTTKPVPAHYEAEPARGTLEPTLDPAKFSGQQREAYRIVREVPELIAQLPCYCYCDRGFGHKSLHSCYVDDHAAHCAVCVDEVLDAYDMQKRGLSAQQIREKIIAKYGA